MKNTTQTHYTDEVIAAMLHIYGYCHTLFGKQIAFEVYPVQKGLSESVVITIGNKRRSWNLERISGGRQNVVNNIQRDIEELLVEVNNGK